MAPSRSNLARAAAAGVVAALALASPAAAGRVLLDDAPMVGAVAPNGQTSGGQPVVVGAVAPGGHHANPPMCWGDTITAYGGQTLDQIAEGMANGCISEQAYYNELVRLNPQLPSNGALMPGDPICFPVQQASNVGRRLLDTPMVGAVAPNGQHAYPPNCPANQVGWAEAGDTLWKVASDFHCQNTGGWKAWIAGKLALLNPQIPSLWTPLYSGDIICTSVWTCPF